MILKPFQATAWASANTSAGPCAKMEDWGEQKPKEMDIWLLLEMIYKESHAERRDVVVSEFTPKTCCSNICNP